MYLGNFVFIKKISLLKDFKNVDCFYSSVLFPINDQSAQLPKILLNPIAEPYDNH